MFAELETIDFCLISLIVMLYGGGSVVYSYFRPADKARLRRLDEKLDLLLQRSGISYEEAKEALPLSDEVEGLAQDPEQKEKAIEMHSQQTGVPAEEARRVVEAYIATLKTKLPAEPDVARYNVLRADPATEVGRSAGNTSGYATYEDAMRKQLGLFAGTRKPVRLTRGYPVAPQQFGFVVGLGHEWVLLQKFIDFYPEGYTALRVKDVTDLRSGECERNWERMLSGEGLLDRIAAPGDVPLDDVAQLLKALQLRGQNVIVKCEDPNKNAEAFNIGQILSVDKDWVMFAHFDVLGRWDHAPRAIPLGRITRVQFETPYVQSFSKYLEGPYRRTP
jgi:hypothetical protein